LKFPEAHHLRIRTTNGLERIIEELRRRTKVMGRLPSESAALKLVYAVASTYARTWRGLVVTTEQLSQIDQLVAEPKKPQQESAVVAVG
jgi:transposase-like protein